jgi:hypothetical protein
VYQLQLQPNILRLPTNGNYNHPIPKVGFIVNIDFLGLGSNIGRGLFVEGWVEHPDILCWVLFLYPTLPAIFVLSAKPNKMAEDRIVPIFCFRVARLINIKIN